MTERAAFRFATPAGAVFSRCRGYRYALWRTWSPEGRKILFIGLNPSRADERGDDPTIRRCMAFARSWGFGGVLVGNLFAWRTPEPRALRRSERPIGPANGRWLGRLGGRAERILVCWGRHGRFMERDRAFADRYEDLWCLGINRDGTPTHPLYIPADRQPRPWPHRPAGGDPRGSAA